MSARDEYNLHPGVNWSLLKHMADSPMAFRFAQQHGWTDTKALAIGRAVHALVFEPHVFNAEFAIWEGERRGKEWKEFSTEHAGSTILTEAEAEPCLAMAAAVRGHTLVQRYDSGVFEAPIYWSDPSTGVLCKARPDWVTRDRVLIDLKTTRSIAGRRFGAEAARYAYHCQMAHYRNGMLASGSPASKVVLVAVEKTPPHDVGVFEIDESTLDLASQAVEALLVRYKECEESGKWPGRYDAEQALELPAWVYCDEDDDAAEAMDLIIGG